MGKFIKWTFLLALAAFLIHHWWLSQPVEHGPGIVAPYDPVQTEITEPQRFEFKGYTFIPAAEFWIEARILSRERYFIDPEAKLSPIDLALGWGRMSDEQVLEKIKIRQGGRFYHWRVREFPIPRREIETNSANMHLIPADKAVKKTLFRTRQGNVVRLNGYLVKIRGEGGWYWNSSMTREDTGNHACEVIYVTSCEVVR
jgi:hypothetical protein